MKAELNNSANLIAWLRGKPRSPLHGKPSKVSLRRIFDLRSKLSVVLRDVGELSITTRMEDTLPHLDKLIHELNEQLALYASTPTFTLYDGRSWGIDDALDTYQRIPVGESLAARALCEIAYQNQLERVRACTCGTWFFAIRGNQISCSPACRKSKHQQTEAFKAKRREYMREYYALKQSGKVK